jgi:hypothetical protein
MQIGRRRVGVSNRAEAEQIPWCHSKHHVPRGTVTYSGFVSRATRFGILADNAGRAVCILARSAAANIEYQSRQRCCVVGRLTTAFVWDR